MYYLRKFKIIKLNVCKLDPHIIWMRRYLKYNYFQDKNKYRLIYFKKNVFVKNILIKLLT